MQSKLRTRVIRAQRAAASVGAGVGGGKARSVEAPPQLTQPYVPTPTPTRTLLPTRTPLPTNEPTSTPTPTATIPPTPTLDFPYNFVLTGNAEDPEEQILVISEVENYQDTFYLRTSLSPGPFIYLMLVYIDNEFVATVQYRSDRAGTQFGYRRALSELNVPEFIGTFPANAEAGVRVDLSLPVWGTATPTPTNSSTPTPTPSATSTQTPEPTETLEPTETPTETPEPTPTPTETINPTFLSLEGELLTFDGENISFNQ